MHRLPILLAATLLYATVAAQNTWNIVPPQAPTVSRVQAPARFALPLLLQPQRPNIGVSAADILDCFEGCTLLPVRFLKLAARRLDSATVVVEWETTHEPENAGFTIERSLQNSRQFRIVGWVTPHAAATAIERYNFTDANDFRGDSYYRIRQTDRDSQMTYSSVVRVEGLGAAKLIVWPNPSGGMAQVQWSSHGRGQAVLRLNDATGRTVWEQNVQVNKGWNNFPLPGQRLHTGTYIVQLYFEGTWSSVLFVRQ